MGHNASAGLVRMAVTAALLCLPSTSIGQQTAAPAGDTSVRPFTISIPDAVLADLKTRLQNSRFPEPLQGDGWALGTDIRYLKELIAYWRDTFDWRAQERRLNGFEQFTTTIDGLTVHFMVIPSISRVRVLVAATRARLRPGTHRHDRGEADGAPWL